MESLVKQEDDTPSRSASFHSDVILNPAAGGYAQLAARFEINVLSAKKYHSVLTKCPRVPVIRHQPIKQEDKPILLTPPPVRYFAASSPVFGRQKRVRKPPIKREPQSPVLSRRKSSSSSINNKIVNEKLGNYFNSLDEPSIKQEIKSPELAGFSQGGSAKDAKPLVVDLESKITKTWEVLIDTSGDEFEGPRKVTISKSKPATAKPLDEKNGVVTNPFSKVRRRKRAPKIAAAPNAVAEKQKKKSFWTDQFGADSHGEKRKKFIKTFVKRTRGKAATANNTPDNEIIVLDASPPVRLANNAATSTKEKKVKKKKYKKIKIKEENDYGNSSSTVSCCEEGETINSLSVNCQPLFTLADIKVEHTPKMSSSAQGDAPLSFGSGAAETNQAEEETRDVEVSDEIRIDVRCDAGGNAGVSSLHRVDMRCDDKEENGEAADMPCDNREFLLFEIYVFHFK